MSKKKVAWKLVLSVLNSLPMRLNVKHTLMLTCSGIAIVFLGPKVFSGSFPKLTARIEALTNLDLSGRGRCRLDNTQAVLKIGSGKLVSGFVTTPGGTSFGHLWGKSVDGKIIDCACPETNLACRNRTEVAEYDPFLPGVPVTMMTAVTPSEIRWAKWGRDYLATYIPIVSKN